MDHLPAVKDIAENAQRYRDDQRYEAIDNQSIKSSNR
jgi:hypothetical protein